MVDIDTAGGTDTLTEARAALGDVVPRLTALVGQIPDSDRASVGAWRAAQVAAHLSHVFRLETDAIAGRPAPPATVTAAGMAEFNEGMLAADRERDPAVLADRIGALADEFEEAAARSTDDTVSWLQGARMAPSAVACHLLVECLIHGHDIARATDLRWPIAHRHALLAVEGGVFPLIAALPPTAMVDRDRAGALRACIELRLRGGARTFLAVSDGALTVDSRPRHPVDAHLSADPAALMLTFLRRQGVTKPVLTGKLGLWGRRPWKLARMLTAISPP